MASTIPNYKCIDKLNHHLDVRTFEPLGDIINK
uniref:Uncharacterized protein n=1 Tax=Tetranychus urticae TaxID=32264 RepID=T1KY91_TETUR